MTLKCETSSAVPAPVHTQRYAPAHRSVPDQSGINLLSAELGDYDRAIFILRTASLSFLSYQQ